MAKQVFQLPYLILLVLFSNHISADETKTAEQEFLSTLLAAKSEDERSILLESNKNAVTVELRKALIEKGHQFRLKSDLPNALATFELANQVAEKIDDRAGIAYALRGIGLVHDIQGNGVLALDFLQKSLVIAQEVNDKSLEAGCLRSIGNVHSSAGNPELALENYRKSLQAAEVAGDKLQIAATRNNIGLGHVAMGNFSIALEEMEKSLALQEELGNKELAASTLNNMAIIHDYQGNYELALEQYRKSLKLSEEVGDRLNVANVLNNIGDFRLLNSYEAALEYNKKSLKIAEELGDKRLAARACVNIGNKYRGTGDYDQALNYSMKALSIAESIDYQPVIGSSQRLTSTIFYLKKNYQKSLESADRALSVARKIADRQSIWRALEAKGKAHRQLNQPEVARKSFDEAMAVIEDWRLQVAGGEMETQGLFADKVAPYHEMIDLLIEEDEVSEAFSYAERAKARVLLDVIRSGKASVSEKMTAEEREREKKLSKELGSLNRRIQDERMKSGPDQKQLADLESKVQKARLDFEDFRTKLYVAHPELKVHRGEANPLNANEAIELFADSKTVLLEFVVTDDKTFLFVLDSTKKIPNVYSISITQEKLAEKVRDFRTRMGNRDPRFSSAAQELFELLFGNVSAHLKNKDKVILVPDDVLWSLPFQALQTAEHRFLLEDYALSYVPSLTVLRETKNLHNERNFALPGTLLAFGNPTIKKETMERVQRIYRNERLDPLPEAEKEVIGLQQLYGTEHSKIYVGSEAREHRIKNEGSGFRVLHLATHGIVNDVAPMYSQLILAQGTDTEEDGILEAWEIMNLKLNAELVVLSACDTALGKIQKGEGMIGLAWSLFVAGSPTTVASQWKVDSASTTELMLGFHQNLKTNISKAEALRQASLKLLHTDEYHHPFYWAPYVLIGDGF